jgi:hypothetical protein
MSQQGIRGFYQITETIETQLLADVNVNTVTTTKYIPLGTYYCKLCYTTRTSNVF